MIIGLKSYSSVINTTYHFIIYSKTRHFSRYNIVCVPDACLLRAYLVLEAVMFLEYKYACLMPMYRSAAIVATSRCVTKVMSIIEKA